VFKLELAKKPEAQAKQIQGERSGNLGKAAPGAGVNPLPAFV
jgi:hypothetical protein